jgi:peptide-methionine (S)-S-oxide reductase
VGYTGGLKRSPTYRSLGDHTEALQVDFDPGQLSYEEVVGLFWQSHNPVGAPRGRQYMSAIWYANQSQRDVIDATKEAMAERLGQDVNTPVLPLETFYNAEDYHQKYCLQRHQPLMTRFEEMYPDFRGVVDSTAAARLNGFAGGQGTAVLLDEERADYGFAPEELDAVIRRGR